MIMQKVVLKCWTFKALTKPLRPNGFKKYLDPQNKGKWKLLLAFFLNTQNIELLLHGNLNPDDVASLGIEEPFTKELIETWSCLNFKKQLSNFGETPIWYNSLICINNKPIYYRSWFSAGVSLISHLLTNFNVKMGSFYSGK